VGRGFRPNNTELSSGYIAECHYLDGVAKVAQQTLVNTMKIVVYGNLKPMQELMVIMVVI
jgi:hypothetical protein